MKKRVPARALCMDTCRDQRACEDLHDENLLMYNICMLAAARRDKEQEAMTAVEGLERSEWEGSQWRARRAERQRREERQEKIWYAIIAALLVLTLLSLCVPPAI